jgi:hypothetical protein
MENQVVQQQIPYNVTKYQAVEQRRRVPYSVQRPVTRTIENKVPVDKVEWVEQEMVRPKTVQRTSYKVETKEKDVEVQFYETEAVTTKVKVPRKVAEYQPYHVKVMVPRTVQMPVTLSYVDPYAVPISQGRNSWMPVIGDVVTYGAGVPVTGSNSPANSAPQQTVKKIETSGPKASETPATEPESVTAPAPELDLSPSNKNEAPKA